MKKNAAKKSGKVGRPALAEKKKKNERISVRANWLQKELIVEKAASMNMTASGFLLGLGLSKKFLPAPPAVNFEMLSEINLIGMHLETLVELLENNNKNIDSKVIVAVVERAQATISETRALLIGKNAFGEKSGDDIDEESE